MVSAVSQLSMKLSSPASASRLANFCSLCSAANSLNEKPLPPSDCPPPVVTKVPADRIGSLLCGGSSLDDISDCEDLEPERQATTVSRGGDRDIGVRWMKRSPAAGSTPGEGARMIPAYAGLYTNHIV